MPDLRSAEKRQDALSAPSPSPGWRLPLNRIGVILTSYRNGSGTEDMLMLGVKGAKQVVSEILGASYPAYTKDLWRGLCQSPANSDVTIGNIDEELPEVRFRPGPIIDFPRVNLEWKPEGQDRSFKISAGLCITVCLYKNRSKIWLRYLWEDAPPAADEKLMSDFRQATENWTADLLDVLMPLYAKNIEVARAANYEELADFDSYVDGREAQWKTDLSIKHRVQFLAVDTEVEGYDALAAQASIGKRLSEVQNAPEACAQLSELLKIYAPNLKGDPLLVEHTTTRGRTGVFAAITQRGRRVYIGLGALAPGESYPDDHTLAGRPPSGALQATAAMAFMLAKEFNP